jgi:hypothetical protein
VWRVLFALCVAVVACGCQRSDRADAGLPDLRITPELCGRVRPGMTPQEVKAAIGGPPGFYEGTCGIAFDPNGPGPRSKKGDESWVGRQGEVEVIYDDNQKAIRATWYQAKDIWLR